MNQLSRNQLKQTFGGALDVPPEGANCGGTGQSYCWASCGNNVFKSCHGYTCSSTDGIGAFCTQSDDTVKECRC